MAQDKKSFILYSDLIHTVKHLTNEQAGDLFKHILEYVNDNDPVSENPITNIAFEPIKQQLKRDLKKFEDVKVKRSIAGKASAEKRKQNSTNSTSVKSVKQTSTNPTDNVNVNDNVNVIVNVNDINKRKEEFKNSLTPFLELYNKDLLNEFFSYWAEAGLKDRKMRFEKEKSFGLDRRLITWKKNKDKWSNENKKQTFSEEVLGQEKANQLMDLLNQNDNINDQKNLL